MARRCAAAVFLCAACGAFSPPSAARFSSPRRAAASTQSSPDVARVTSLFDDAVAKLSDTEKYNQVIQGLVARADEPNRGVDQADARRALIETFGLLDEMVERSLQCSDQTLKCLIDAAAASGDVGVMAQILRRTGIAGASSRYASDQGRLVLLPTDDRRRGRAIADAPELPLDDREREVSAGLAFATVSAAAVLLEVMRPTDTLVATVAFAALAVGAFLDIASGAQFINLVGAGLGRLTLRDPERESDCEAASFLVAYLTGLPSFCYSPNVVQAAKIAELPELSLSTDAGVHRLLVWHSASVAAESARHEQLIASDPRQVRARRACPPPRYRAPQKAAASSRAPQAAVLLKYLRSRNLDGTPEGAASDSDRVRWAFGQARVLVRRILARLLSSAPHLRSTPRVMPLRRPLVAAAPERATSRSPPEAHGNWRRDGRRLRGAHRARVGRP